MVYFLILPAYALFVLVALVAAGVAFVNGRKNACTTIAVVTAGSGIGLITLNIAFFFAIGLTFKLLGKQAGGIFRGNSSNSAEVVGGILFVVLLPILVSAIGATVGGFAGWHLLRRFRNPQA